MEQTLTLDIGGELPPQFNEVNLPEKIFHDFFPCKIKTVASVKIRTLKPSKIVYRNVTVYPVKEEIEPVGNIFPLPEGYSVSREKGTILKPPKGSIVLMEDKFMVNTEILSSNSYYFVPKLNYVVRKRKENSIELYERFELKTGELILYKLLEAESE